MERKSGIGECRGGGRGRRGELLGVESGQKRKAVVAGEGKQREDRDGFVEETHEDGCGQAGKLFGMVTAVSCGKCDSQRWGTELDLGSGEPLDDDHRRATVGTKPKRARFPGRGCFWFGLGWNSAECCAAQR